MQYDTQPEWFRRMPKATKVVVVRENRVNPSYARAFHATVDTSLGVRARRVRGEAAGEYVMHCAGIVSHDGGRKMIRILVDVRANAIGKILHGMCSPEGGREQRGVELLFASRGADS